MADKKTVCIHEAGHVIAAMNFRVFVGYTQCMPTSFIKRLLFKLRNFIRFFEFRKSSFYGYTHVNVSSSYNERLVIAASGVVAEALLERNFQGSFDIAFLDDKRSGEKDFDTIFRIVNKAREECIWTFSINEACEHAWKLLKQNSKGLRALADELEAKCYLAKHEIDQIVTSVNCYVLPNLLID